MAKPTLGMLGSGLANNAGAALQGRNAQLAIQEAMLEPGNIKWKTIGKPLAVNIDGEELVLPTMTETGKPLSAKEAIEMYQKTGMHLGKFADQNASAAFANTFK